MERILGIYKSTHEIIDYSINTIEERNAVIKGIEINSNAKTHSHLEIVDSTTPYYKQRLAELELIILLIK